MKIALAIGGVVILAAAALWLEFRQQQALQGEVASLRQTVNQLTSDNAALSNRIAAATDANQTLAEQQNELLRLRGEVATLRQQNNRLTQQAQQAQDQAARQQARNKTNNGAPNESNAAPEQPDQSIPAKANDARRLVFALLKYADNNQGQFPADLNPAGPFLDADYTGTNSFELVYHGPRETITDPSSTIVVRENSAWQMPDGRWAKTYGFADGHAEVHPEANGDFTAWEQKRTLTTTP